MSNPTIPSPIAIASSDAPTVPTAISAGGGSTPSVPSAITVTGGGSTPSAPSAITVTGAGSTPSAPSAITVTGAGSTPSVPAAIAQDALLDLPMFEPREGDIDSVTASTAVIFSPSSGSLVENEYSGGYLVVSGKVYQIVSHDSDGILVLATSITATLGPAVIYKAAPAANTVTGQSAPANPSAIAVAGVGAPSTPSAIQQVAQAAPDVPSAFVLPDEQPPSAPQVGPSTPVVITHTVQLTDDENYRVMVTSRSAPVTVALPDPGGLNQDIEVIDASMQANVHAITIDPGTRTIEGQASLVLTYSGAAVKLTYTGTAWKITS